MDHMHGLIVYFGSIISVVYTYIVVVMIIMFCRFASVPLLQWLPWLQVSTTGMCLKIEYCQYFTCQRLFCSAGEFPLCYVLC